MLGLRLRDLGLSHGLAGHCHSEARHQTLAHANGSNGKKAYELKCPQLHAPAAEWPSRCHQTDYEIVSAICSRPMSRNWFFLIALFYL